VVQALASDSPPAARSSRLALGLVLAALGAIAFSGKAIIVKLGYRYGVDAVTLIMFRMLFALPIFVLMAWWAGRGKPRLDWVEWRVVVFLGVTGYYLSSFLDFLGLQYISASLERLILYLNPTLVMLMGLVIYRRRVGPLQLLGMLISYGGIVVVCQCVDLCGVSGLQRRIRAEDRLLALGGSGIHRRLPVLYRAVLVAQAGFSSRCAP
jgi:drug/metabolite transporter (DMT)-like permease